MGADTLPTQEEHIEVLTQREIPAYESMRVELERKHRAKWVVIRDQTLQGTYDTFEAAAADASRRFARPYLIRQVGAPPASLPASVIYRPIYD